MPKGIVASASSLLITTCRNHTSVICVHKVERMFPRGLTELQDVGTVEWAESDIFLGPLPPRRSGHFRLEVADAEF
jgi:hypothetical protein